MRIKICGITCREQATAIAELGATALGFICVPTSPRYVTPAQVAAIAARLPQQVDRIGVFANAPQDEIYQVVTIAKLTGVQLHGDESPEFCSSLRQLLPQVEILKALRIRNAQTLVEAKTYINTVDTLLLDAYHPQQLGGTGKTLDWANLQQFQPACPWLLAGGLTPENILDALKQTNPSGIDLSSGVERYPGDKDLAKVAQLFQRLSTLKKPVDGESS